MAAKDITNLIERLEAFEDRLNVRLEAMSAQLDEISDDAIYLEVRGELHPKDGMELGHDHLVLVVAAYDSDSRVIGTTKEYFTKENFFGFNVFNISVSVPVNSLKRIRIYPERCE